MSFQSIDTTVRKLIASNEAKNATRPGYRKLCTNPKKLRARLLHPERYAERRRLRDELAAAKLVA